jgi:hypothetical protein
MAKNMMPMKSGSSLLSKLVGLIIVSAVLMLIIKYPSDAAGWVTGGAHLFANVVSGLVAFFRQLGS